MKKSQKIYDLPNITNDIYKYQSTEIHRKNIIEIMKRKNNKLYQINEEFINKKKRSNSKKPIKCKKE